MAPPSAGALGSRRPRSSAGSLRRWLLPAFLPACLLAVAVEVPPHGETAFQQPQQIHIGYGHTPSEMTVHWTSMQASGQAGPAAYDPGESFVMYGEREDELRRVVLGEHFLFRDCGSEGRSYTMHAATMKGLSPSKVYSYIVGGNASGWSQPFRFRTAPGSREEVEARLPMAYAIFGDQGDYNGQTIPSLQAEARRRTLDVVVHIGDMAYDLDSDNGRNGDSWMRDIEPLAATVPYMTAHGNHEANDNFNHYTQRFRNMPSNSGSLTFPEFGTVPNNWWYSWDSGLVHFVVVSTEVAFFFADPKREELLSSQESFLRSDLAAVNRTRTPWVIVTGHRPLYCSSGKDCEEAATVNRMGLPDGKGGFRFGLEAILYEFGVDLYLSGHEHSYERLFDVAPAWDPSRPSRSGKTTRSTADPPATTYIVTGSAGNVESHSGFEPDGGAWSAARLNTYGWSRMWVFNATHILWQQVQTDNGQPSKEWGKVADETWIVQRHHGPFARHPRRNATYFEGGAPASADLVTVDVRHAPGYVPYEDRPLACTDAALLGLLGRWQATKLSDLGEAGPSDLIV